jgi:hypothetical protein
MNGFMDKLYKCVVGIVINKLWNRELYEVEKECQRIALTIIHYNNLSWIWEEG